MTTFLDKANETGEVKPDAIIDRSTLESWVECPNQGWAREHENVLHSSPQSIVGDIVHEAASRLVHSAAEGEVGSIGQAVGELEHAVLTARPDLSKAAWEACRASVYSMARHILYKPESGERRHPEDFERYDGGQGMQSGQVAHDYEYRTWDGDDKPRVIRYTCELDLLTRTPSEKMLRYTDWKSGHKHYGVTDLSESFQLSCFYPVLILLNYPQVEAVEIAVFNTRFNTMTPPILFRRDKDMERAMIRLETAVKVRMEHASKTIRSAVPTQPLPDRCTWCDYLTGCPMASEVDKAAAKEMAPAEALQRLTVLEASRTAVKSRLGAYVKEHGDLVVGNMAYGIDKEKKPRRPTAELYTVTTYEKEPDHASEKSDTGSTA